MSRLKQQKDYVNSKIGELTVLSKVGKSKHGYTTWLCQCSCGNQVTYDTTRLWRGLTKTCGLCSHAGMYKGCGELSRTYWCSLKAGAKQRKLEFKISIEYAWQLYENQKGKCALTGLNIGFPKKWILNSRNDRTASLDRIDAKKGYIEGNLWWIHKEINIIKGQLTPNELINWCNKIIDNVKNENFIPPDVHLQGTKTGYKNISGEYFWRIQDQAKSRNIIFDISIEDIWNQYEKQKFLCNLTGEPIIFSNRRSEFEQTASLDRIDNTKGYSIDNIQIVHKIINKLKWDFGSQELLEWCKKIYEYQIANKISST